MNGNEKFSAFLPHRANIEGILNQLHAKENWSLVERCDEVDHTHRGGHSGAPPKVASPESITLGQWLWIPGSPLRGAPE
jgi:hypothetical protein